MGPTASGKTALAIEIAKSGSFEIVNGDAMQIYREIPIITAQPTEAEKEGIPHYLFGYKMGNQSCSVANWLNDAQNIIKQIHSKGKVPLIVGGSGLYFKALTDGLSNMPTIDPHLRIATRTLFGEIGKEQFYQHLTAIDPKIAGKINAGDSQRMIRAYEVFKQTGKSITYWYQEDKLSRPEEYDFLQIQLDLPRNILYAKINQRFLHMFENGAVEEARYIMNKYRDQKLSINKAHGIPELINYLSGTVSREAAIERAQTITRQYAKRQVTWLKNQTTHLKKSIYQGSVDLLQTLNSIKTFLS